MRYDYWTGKLLDWRSRTDDLLAVARIALRQLRRGGYSDEERAAILAFLEQVFAVPRAQEDALLAALRELEDEPTAQVMSRWERSGMRKGREEGRRELLQRLLVHKLGELGAATDVRIQALSGRRLLALYAAALAFTDRAELDRWLAPRLRVHS